MRAVFDNPAFKKWYYNLCGYNKYGFYYDDLYKTHESFYVEALRRLPPREYDDYNYRNIRASQLEINKAYLPKDQWPTYEEDLTKGRFLQPYINEILAEKKEKEDWEAFLAKK